jgi:undecaprenyl-diphosphatase
MRIRRKPVIRRKGVKMEFLEILKAILFGLVEGITEWLPISSTGHMILLDEFVKLNVSEEFLEMFLVVVQLGAILAVVLLFWNQLFPFQFHSPYIKKDIFSMWFKIIIACIPAAMVGLFFDDYFNALFYNYQTVAIALIVFGILFIIIEDINKNRKPKVKRLGDITYPIALIIGLFQLIAAIFPGTSRSGATIIGALAIGVSRTTAAEFTFFLAIPVMFGASLLKVVKFIAKVGFAFSSGELMILLIGMAVAFIVSIIVIKFLMGYIKKNNFKVFGWYRIVLGIVVLLYFNL